MSEEKRSIASEAVLEKWDNDGDEYWNNEKEVDD